MKRSPIIFSQTRSNICEAPFDKYNRCKATDAGSIRMNK